MNNSTSFLKYFITEEIYLVPQKHKEAEAPATDALKVDETPEVEKAVFKDKRTYPLTTVAKDLNDSDIKLLKAILSAVNIDYNEMQLLQSEAEELKSNRILIFGNFYNDLPEYQLTTKETATFLKAENLSVISANVEKKKKLWTALQQMFNV